MERIVKPKSNHTPTNSKNIFSKSSEPSSRGKWTKRTRTSVKNYLFGHHLGNLPNLRMTKLKNSVEKKLWKKSWTRELVQTLGITKSINMKENKSW